MYTTNTRHTTDATYTRTEIETEHGIVSYATFKTNKSFTQHVMWYSNSASVFDIINANENSIKNIWDLVKNN